MGILIWILLLIGSVSMGIGAFVNFGQICVAGMSNVAPVAWLPVTAFGWGATVTGWMVVKFADEFFSN